MSIMPFVYFWHIFQAPFHSNVNKTKTFARWKAHLMILFLLTKQQSPLLNDNVTKIYQNTPPRLGASINLGTKITSTKLRIRDRVKHIAWTPALLTLKDHKDKFRSNPTCRCLINPSKSKLGKVSKQLVENRNSDIILKIII